MTITNYKIDSASISDRGLSEKRPQNEDSFLELNDRGLFVVADGVGGAQAGEVASQMAVEILGEAFVNLRQGGDAEELMQVAIERANTAIFQMSHDLTQLSTMATTVVALHVAGTIATIGHVGDSRLYRLDPQGSFFRETQDHSMVEEEVRAGRMTTAQAATHPSRNVISRALGAEHSVEVDMKTMMVEPNTIFLLCSDGITRHIDDFQLRELLLYKDSPESICRRMKEICYERGAEDNLTAVIAKVTDVEIKKNPAIPPEKSVEYEEPTVAAARPQPSVKVIDEQSYVEETPTQPLLQMPVTNNASELITAPFVTSSHDLPSAQPAASVEESVRVPIGREPAGDEQTSSGKMSRLLSSLLFLILGGVAGAGIYHLFLQNNRQPPIPQITQMQTSKPDYESFENLRRSVDGNPNTYINTNANITQDAEGSYLLGRAYLLTAKYPEAKKHFEEAKNKLAQSNAVNSTVLANDIALGLAIVDEAAAQNKFQNQLNPNASNADLPTNINTNTVVR